VLTPTGNRKFDLAEDVSGRTYAGSLKNNLKRSWWEKILPIQKSLKLRLQHVIFARKNHLTLTDFMLNTEID
jgi:hypothetical protein